MIDVTEIERMISTLRHQAQVLNQAADTLEASMAPYKLMAEQMAAAQKIVSTWQGMFFPKT